MVVYSDLMVLCRLLPFVARSSLLTLFLIASAPASAAAETGDQSEIKSLGESERSLPALMRLAMPLPAAAPVVASAGLGYGYMGPVLDITGGSRIQTMLSAAYAPLPYLMIGADLSGRLDIYPQALRPNDERGDTNLYGESRFTLRYVRSATPQIYWGLQADVRFVGAEAPNIHWNATSPSFRGNLAYHLDKRTWLTAELGLHLDNSARSVTDTIGDPTRLITSDRLSLGASSFNAIPWGIGASHQLDLGKAQDLELLAEFSGETHVGSGAPGFSASPWGLGLGARTRFNENLSAQAQARVSFSTVPEPFPLDTLYPIEPRLSVGLSLTWRFGVTKPGTEPEPTEEVKEEVEEKEDAPPPEAQVKTSSVKGVVVDEGGRPLSDVQVTITQGDAEPKEERTYANGGYEFTEVPEGEVEVLIETPGYDDVKLVIKEGEEREREVVMYPSLPAGQVKGQVLDMRGKAVDAKVTITPGNKTVEVSADGSFELELAPGTYTVRFQHPDHAPQKRVIRVQDRGVVILNIGLQGTSRKK